MKTILGTVALTVSLTTCGAQQSLQILDAAGAGAGHAGGTFQTRDARLALDLPRTWYVEDHWPESPTFFTNFPLGASCCGLRDGQIKIDVFHEPARVNNVRELFVKRCGSGRRGGAYDCKIVSSHGREWAWVYADDVAGEGVIATVTAVTVDGASLVTAVAFVPNGDFQLASIATVERIFRTLHVR